MRRSLPFCLAGLLAAVPLAAQAPLPPDSMLGRLIGRWVLQGPMAGLPQVADLGGTGNPRRTEPHD